MENKKVVIAKRSSILSVYWFKEFLKLKGYHNIYCYKRKTNKEHEIVGYELLKNQKDIKAFEYAIMYKYSIKDLGDYISLEDFETLDENILIEYYDITNDREDKDLITITEKINNSSIIKVVEIPIDVEYEIKDYDCAIGEYIEECHRSWD